MAQERLQRGQWMWMLAAQMQLALPLGQCSMPLQPRLPPAAGLASSTTSLTICMLRCSHQDITCDSLRVSRVDGPVLIVSMDATGTARPVQRSFSPVYLPQLGQLPLPLAPLFILQA